MANQQKTGNKKSRWRTSGFFRLASKKKLLLLGFFSSVLGFGCDVLSGFGNVSSGASSGVGCSAGGSSSGFASSVSSGSGGVSSSLGSVSGSSASGGSSVSSALGFGSGSVGGSGGVSSLLLLGAGGQGQAQGHRDQQLVDAHCVILVVEIWQRAIARREHDDKPISTVKRSRIHISEFLKFPNQINSMAMAVASPPPMQSDATPRLRPRVRNAFTSVTTKRAPDAPIG